MAINLFQTSKFDLPQFCSSSKYSYFASYNGKGMQIYDQDCNILKMYFLKKEDFQNQDCAVGYGRQKIFELESTCSFFLAPVLDIFEFKFF